MGIKNTFIKLFRKYTQGDIFEKAPYLSPWYFKESRPLLRRNGVKLKWNWIEKIGKEYVGTTILQRDNNECLGIVKTYTYLLPAIGNDKFLVWVRQTNDSGPLKIEISLFDCEGLDVIKDSERLVLELKEKKDIYFQFNSKPKSTISLKIDSSAQEICYTFPEDFQFFEDFCVISEVNGLYKNSNSNWHNTAIIILSPKNNKLHVYPQDWFNKSNCDFGYQWITRAAKNEETGLIHGQGIRIDDFVLNSTNRQILREQKDS